MSYTPTPGPHPGKQYVPSNGSEGDIFLHDWCAQCARDKSMRDGAAIDECDDTELCEIIAASFRGEAVEWREMPDGETKCIAFVRAGEPIPPPRDEYTMDMFWDAP